MKRVLGLLLAVVVAAGILPAKTQAAVGSEETVILTESYTFTSGDRLENTDYCGRIFPVTVSSGGTIVVTVNAEVLQKDVVMRLYTDADDSFINTLTMDVEFYTSSELTLMPNQWYALGNTADAKYYTLTADSTLKNGSFTTIYPGDSRNATYLKLRPTADGYITVKLYKGVDYDDSAYLTLLDAGGRAISGAEWLYLPGSSSGKAVFGVKKNKTIKGSIPAGSSQADWYRVKLTGKQKIKMTVSADASDSIRMQLYDAKGKKLGGSRVLSGGGSKKQTITTKSTRKAGTYYIRIYRGSSKSSGHYALKWG